MENPGMLLHRAQLAMRFRTAIKPSSEMERDTPKLTTEPVHRSSHANYTALMRSHDRMRTRHIGGQGGETGA